ncbi:MAG: zinc ABC transporter substrate-binding protein [Parachlamydiales bacterium]|nr:zinc ABC transporter substrate-binding protein [Parachlamydiales bacterium]
MNLFYRLLFLGIFLSCNGCFQKKPIEKKEKISVFVSILPLKNFVEEIGKDYIDVQVMVLPGQSPETYAPMPKQIEALGRADLYYKIGVPFENMWMDKMQKNAPHLRVIDVTEDLPISHEEDPHVWMNPLYVIRMCERIVQSLVSIDPDRQQIYQKNCLSFQKKLSELDEKLQKQLSPFKGRAFLVFHPAWGYFAKRYGLLQLAIEKEGKDPGPRDILAIIAEAKKENISAIFVQKQFDQKNARVIAEALQAKIIVADPLAEKYILNMEDFTQQLIHSFHDAQDSH